MLEFVDYCAEQGCQGAEVTSYYFPKQIERDFLLALRRHAFLRGVELSGTAVGNRFTLPAGAELEREVADVKRWIDRAALLGALIAGLYSGDLGLVSRSLVDRVAEPLRSPYVPGFDAVKEAALAKGALGSSLSGSGPSIFALCADLETATAASTSMHRAFSDATGLEADLHVSRVSIEGAHVVNEGKSSCDT